MSSWFASGFSQITDQISNFTKEVIEEGTGEVDDPVTQLKITQKHLVKLDGHNQSQHAELEKLKEVNCELQEKLESAELQINALSNEYREIVDRKDTEIKQLKLLQDDLCEGKYRPLETAASCTEAISQLTHSSSTPSLNDGSLANQYDFDDIISCQQEINRLQNEKKKLEVQCLHWMQLVQSAEDRKETDQLHQLQSKLENLQQEYDKEIDSHQTELAALHNAYSQKIALLKHKYQDEIARQDEASEQRTQAIPESGNVPAQSDINDQLQHLQTIHQKLTVDLELTHAADKEKAHQLQQLQQRLDDLQLEHQQVLLERDSLINKTDGLMEQLDSVVSELREKNEEINQLTKQDQQNDSQSDSTGFAARYQEEHSEMIQLKEQLSDCKLQIEQFDLIKSDWQMEKEALEDVLLKLREQLRESNVSVSKQVPEQQTETEGLTKSSSDSPIPIEDQTSKIDILPGECSENETNTEKLWNENERRIHLDADEMVADGCGEMMQKESKENQTSQSGLTKQIDELLTENLTLKERICILEKDMDDLDQQHQKAMHELGNARDELSRDNTELSCKLQDLMKEKDNVQHSSNLKCRDLEMKISSLEDESSKSSAAMHDLQLMNEKLLKTISMVEEEKHELSSNIQDLVIDRDKFEDNCSKLTAEIEHTNSELKLARKDVVTLTENLSMAREENQEHLKTIEGLKEEKFNIAHEQEQLKIELSKVTSEYDVGTTESNPQYTNCDIENDSGGVSDVFDENVHLKSSSDIHIESPHNQKETTKTDATENPELSSSNKCSDETPNEDRLTDMKTKIPDLLKRCSDQEVITEHHDPKLGQIDLLTADKSCEIMFDESRKDDTFQDKRNVETMELSHINQPDNLDEKMCTYSSHMQDDGSENVESTVLANNASVSGQTHELQDKVNILQTEKNQIVSVLNDKTRECSSLKSEIRHLMNVVSAEKMALSKLQQENQNLLKEKEMNDDENSEEMSKAAIKKLSQIIRDKDMMIEALNQKNQSLLQVLQESSNDESNISVIQERDKLLKEVSILHKEREHIIATLNVKHQESLAYHMEIQRLSEVVTQKDQIEKELSNIQKQLEQKQDIVIKLQKDVLKYKPKTTESMKYVKTAKEDAVEDEETKSDFLIFLSNCLDPETLEEAVHMYKKSISDKENIIECCTNKLDDKEQKIQQQVVEINEKEKLLSDLNTKLHRTEETLFCKESEISNNKKQTENLTFQLHSMQSELTDLRQERNQLYESNSILQQELAVMKKNINTFTLSISEKDFEIKALKERKTTLSKLIQEKEEGKDDEMDRIMKECETIKKHSQNLKQEKEQGLLAIQHQQTENQHLCNEIQRLNVKKEKLEKELERLRNHLLVIEENYTQDALASEEREKELRNRLAVAEDKMMSSSCAVKSANQQVLQEIDSLQAQLSSVSQERDHALIQLQHAQETANQYSLSLQNLQMVLEQFQIEKETQQNSEMEKLNKELMLFRKENRQMQEKICDLEAQAKETTDALEAAQRLSEQLDCKEEMIAALRDEVQMRESELKKMEDEIHSLAVGKEAKVDKELVKNLILGYIHTPPSQSQEALKLIGRVLDFSQSDMEQMKVEKKQGWLGGLLRRSNPPTSPKAGNPNKSFSELFVTFLERESSPKARLHFPVDGSSGTRNKEGLTFEGNIPGKKSSSFNPFVEPLSIPQSNKDHPPLMKPITPSLPDFKSISSSSGTNILVSQQTVSPFPQIPTNSGSILREVLQK